MAQQAVSQPSVPIRAACQAFGISESCYRYSSQTSAENQEITNWLLRLTDNHRYWGFGLCFLYLRNVKGYGWNHKRVYRALQQVITWRGRPQMIRCDNGPDNISHTLQQWAKDWGIQMQYIQPGKPQQNAYVERFNKTVRYEWLSQYYWQDLQEIQQYATDWMWQYNHQRSHMTLGGITPGNPPKQHLANAASDFY